MLGHWRLFRGMLRRGLLLAYYGAIEKRSLFGMMCRMWGWLHNAKKDSEVAEQPEFEWKFELSEEVQLSHTKYVGMIWYRWICFGWKLYEVKVGRHLHVFYENQLQKTKFRVCSIVKVQEIKFKSLREGHYCLPTKRWVPTPYCNYPMTAYSITSQDRVLK